MSRGLLAVLATVALAGAAYAGLVLYGWQKCAGLEEDYLNSVAAARQSVLLRDLAPDSRAMADVSAGLAEGEVQTAEQLLPVIYEECGVRAGRTAFRKGSAILLGR